ncbi:MAG: hypothetical protein ACRC30_00500 [Clostridium sp.]
MPKYMSRKEINEIIEMRNWTLHTRIDYKKKFSGSDQLRIVCGCGRPQTLGVKSLWKFECPFCTTKNNKNKVRVGLNLGKNYKKEELEIPPYIRSIMKKYPTKRMLALSGEKSNPTIFYFCEICGKDQACKLRNLKKGHNCIGSKSSGEVLVEKFLKEENIKICTQFKTLKCLNPKTGRQLPYDIEIVNKKILIEIQGEQHSNFIEHFHRTIENFEYQKLKDNHKKRWAEDNGYRIVYIYYNELRDGEYKRKILNILGLKC